MNPNNLYHKKHKVLKGVGTIRRLFASLNREKKEALGILQVGTFLEYFDLMLYVHMAILLNDIFFPQADSHTAALMAALAFCSTYVFRPIGALIFGWLGDNIGRKSTIIITTAIMSFSCIIMANLPTYAQIGITATWIVTLCRMLQGMSSMGEIIGAEVYIAETLGRPAAYPGVAFIIVAASLGTMAALGVALLVTSTNLNWRIAFWIGAVIALVGAVARIRLRETPEFLEMKRQKIRQGFEKFNREEEERNPKKVSEIVQSDRKEPVKVKTLTSYFLIFCGWPLCFYLSFIYFNPILKESFGYTSEDIIRHNFYLSIIMLISDIFYAILSCRIHPLKIIKVRGLCALALMVSLPFLVMAISSPIQLFVIQVAILLLSLAGIPAEAIFIYHLPVERRFTYASFLYAIARASMYIVTSLGLVYLGEYFGDFGLWFITLPITFAFLYGVFHFESLERKTIFYRNPPLRIFNWMRKD